MATNSRPERQAALSRPKKRLPVTLADAIRLAVEPVLRRLSDRHNKTAWSFAYRDADTSVSFCVGYSDLASRTPCSAADLYAWGSATKTHTALLILQMTEKGLFKLDDTLVSLANDYLWAISSGRSDLILLFGPEVKDVTVRQLLQMTAGITEYDTAQTRAYQNSHRQDDLSPMWVLNVANHTFRCKDMRPVQQYQLRPARAGGSALPARFELGHPRPPRVDPAHSN